MNSKSQKGAPPDFLKNYIYPISGGVIPVGMVVHLEGAFEAISL